jgi:predicted lipoprotein with Yx(FWY)xxD motif
VTAYTTTLQSELQLVGYYDGAIDGIYGPATVEGVKRLQADSALPETGFVDMATAAVLDDLLAALDLQTAATDLTRTAAVQTVLTVTGFWQGPVDGVWTDELTAALQEFQIALGVEPTGVVDTATLAAFEQAIADRSGVPVTTEAPVATVPDTDEATVLVADSDLGQILTATDGMTVYLFVPDAQDTPTCTDSCAEQWPPVTADEASQISAGDGLDASLLDSVEHPEGVQVTYNGWPLYSFAGDSAPGDTTAKVRAACGTWSTRRATRSTATDHANQQASARRSSADASDNVRAARRLRPASRVSLSGVRVARAVRLSRRRPPRRWRQAVRPVRSGGLCRGSATRAP